MAPSPAEPDIKYANRGGEGRLEIGIGRSLDSTKIDVVVVLAEAVAEKDKYR